MPKSGTTSSSKSENAIWTNMDSIVSIVKRDIMYEVKDIYYNAKDSSFNIAFTNKGDVIKKKIYSTKYFDIEYNLMKVGAIEGLYLYQYDKNKSLAKGDYKTTLD